MWKAILFSKFMLCDGFGLAKSPSGIASQLHTVDADCSRFAITPRQHHDINVGKGSLERLGFLGESFVFNYSGEQHSCLATSSVEVQEMDEIDEKAFEKSGILFSKLSLDDQKSLQYAKEISTNGKALTEEDHDYLSNGNMVANPQGESHKPVHEILEKALSRELNAKDVYGIPVNVRCSRSWKVRTAPAIHADDASGHVREVRFAHVDYMRLLGKEKGVSPSPTSQGDDFDKKSALSRVFPLRYYPKEEHPELTPANVVDMLNLWLPMQDGQLHDHNLAMLPVDELRKALLPQSQVPALQASDLHAQPEAVDGVIDASNSSKLVLIPVNFVRRMADQNKFDRESSEITVYDSASVSLLSNHNRQPGSQAGSSEKKLRFISKRGARFGDMIVLRGTAVLHASAEKDGSGPRRYSIDGRCAVLADNKNAKNKNRDVRSARKRFPSIEDIANEIASRQD